jgi:hypothetical protein
VFVLAACDGSAAAGVFGGRACCVCPLSLISLVAKIRGTAGDRACIALVPCERETLFSQAREIFCLEFRGEMVNREFTVSKFGELSYEFDFFPAEL